MIHPEHTGMANRGNGCNVTNMRATIILLHGCRVRLSRQIVRYASSLREYFSLLPRREKIPIKVQNHSHARSIGGRRAMRSDVALQMSRSDRLQVALSRRV
jgi:hypothetical protein